MPTGLRELDRTPEDESGFALRVRRNFDRLRSEQFVITPFRSVKSDTQVNIDDANGTIAADSTLAPLAVVLLTANGVAGRTHVVKNCGTGGNSVTIRPFKDETIDGAATLVLTDGQVARIQSTGMGWIRL